MNQIMLTSRATQDMDDMAYHFDTSVTRESIFQTLHFLEESPAIGKMLFPGNRQMPYWYIRLDQYLIVYEFTTQDNILVLRVLYLKYSNIAPLFNDRPCKTSDSADGAF